MPPLERSLATTFGPKMQADSSSYRRYSAPNGSSMVLGGSGMALPFAQAPPIARPVSSG